AFTGFASFFQRGVVKAIMELSSFVFMLYLGVKFLRAKTVEATNKIEKRIEEKIHPRTAFGVGFVRVMGNPGVLLLWIVLAANFISREWVEPNGPGKSSCIIGVGVGAGFWFLGLSYAVSQRKKKLTERTLLLMERFSGIGLLIYAMIHGAKIIWQMAHHRI
ncbi:MAG: LysE family transporter, partial [Verrucomicrobiota bacterium]